MTENVPAPATDETARVEAAGEQLRMKTVGVAAAVISANVAEIRRQPDFARHGCRSGERCLRL